MFMFSSAVTSATNSDGEDGGVAMEDMTGAAAVADDTGSGDGDNVIDSPPRPVRTSSPRQVITNSSNLPNIASNSTVSLIPPSSPPRPSQPHRNNTNVSNNFRKYGSIRPPISVLENEFCTTYKLWEEHDAILRRVELKPNDNNNNGGMRRPRRISLHEDDDEDGRNDWRKFKPRQVVGDQNCSSDSENSSANGDGDDVVDEEQEWQEAFAHLRILYSRHRQMYADSEQQPQQQFALGSYPSSRNKNEFLESLCVIDDEDTLEEKLEEVEDDSGAISASPTADHSSCKERQLANEASDVAEEQKQQEQQQQQRKRTDIENLAKLFRPGSKLSGAIETPYQLGLRLASETTTQRDYSLVIMEENECDELGRPKGYLARQTCGRDEQCVFVHVKFVRLSDAKINLGDGREDAEEETADDSPPPPQSQSPLEVEEERITIQIEYVDGEKRYRGYWNPNTLSIEGTVQKLDDCNNSQGATDRGGGMRNSPSTNNFIMSGLISGRAGGVTDSEVSGVDGDNTDGAMTTSVTPATTDSSQRPKNQFKFSLSPCTHLHPRGRVRPPLYRFSIPTFMSLMGLVPLDNDVGLLGTLNSPLKEKVTISEQDQTLFMDELASDDNEKFSLHRDRTEQLLFDTLVKLTELGSIVDFAELARKRNVARRREKWRRRMRKVTPKMKRRSKNKEVAGGEEFDISTFDSDEKKKEQFYDHLAAISWDRLLEAASIQAERTCATFRRRSALLDGLTFQTDEYKYQVMSDLRANGLTLASSHSEWDHCIQMGRTVALGWSWFERGSWGCFERSAVVGKRCVHLLFRMHSRLGVCHEQLEKSFRCADARVSIAKLESFKQVRCEHKSDDDDSEELLCGVCQCDINEADEEDDEDNKRPAVVVTLPCSHSFHWHCIREWLHDHSKCPICRVDLNE